MTRIPLERMSSEIPGLDRILCGGLVEGSSYIIQGLPGAGKTILANQIAFSLLRQGKRVLYVTLLAESHDRLFQSLSTLDFFDGGRIGTDIQYISLFQTLRDEGLPALVSLLRRELARQKCSMLVVDGLLSARDRGDSNLDLKSFVAELQGHAAFTGCTVLLLTSARIDDASPEHTMVDGVLQLQNEDAGPRTIRRMRVAKSRGSPALDGLHQYEIKTAGVVVYPRLESVLAHPTSRDAPEPGRISTGVEGFDRTVEGGLPAASVTLLLGPPGSGKTTFGLQFLNQATPQDPALHFGFFETPARLAHKAAAFGFSHDARIKEGSLKVLWSPLTENLLDRLGHELLDAVRQTGTKRLFIDGFSGFMRAAAYPKRMTSYFSALCNELRATGVTTIMTAESHELFSKDMQTPGMELSSSIDNLMIVQHFQRDGTLVRELSLLKMRDSIFDPNVQTITLGSNGMSVVPCVPIGGSADAFTRRPDRDDGR